MPGIAKMEDDAGLRKDWFCWDPGLPAEAEEAAERPMARFVNKPVTILQLLHPLS